MLMTFAIFAIIALIAFPWSYYASRNQWDGPDYFFPAIVTGFIGIFVSIFANMALPSELGDEVEVVTPLVSLGDVAGVSGSFFLGSGSVETVPVFFYYAEDENGAYRLRHRNAASSAIRETTGEPRLFMTCPDANTAPSWVLWPWEEGPDVDCEYEFGTFYVPEGSVKQNFNLDAQ